MSGPDSGGQWPPQPPWGSMPPSGQYPPGTGYQDPRAPQPGAYPSGPGTPAGWWDQASAGLGTGPTPAVPPGGATQRPWPGTGGSRSDAAKLMGLGVGALGVLNFVWGFLPEVSTSNASLRDAGLSVFAVGPAYVPILLLIAGLLALGVLLPERPPTRFAVAAVSVGGAIGALVALGVPGSIEVFGNPSQVSSGLGAILLVVFGIVQAVLAIAAYVAGAGLVGGAAAGLDPAAGHAVAPSTSGPAGYSRAAPGSATFANRQSGPIVPAPPGWQQADPGAVQPGWFGPPSGPGPGGYPVARSSFGPGAQYPPPGGRGPYREEPATGPQAVVGADTMAGESDQRWADGPDPDAPEVTGPAGGGQRSDTFTTGSAGETGRAAGGLTREPSGPGRDPARPAGWPAGAGGEPTGSTGEGGETGSVGTDQPDGPNRTAPHDS